MNISITIQAPLEIWSAVFSFVLMVCVLIRNTVSNKRNIRNLATLLLINGLLNLSSALNFYLYKTNLLMGSGILKISYLIFFISIFLIHLHIMFFVSGILLKYDVKVDEKIKNVSRIVAIVGVLALIASRIYDFFYYFDKNSFEKESNFILVLMEILILMAVNIYITFKNIKKLSPLERAGFIILEICPLIDITLNTILNVKPAEIYISPIFSSFALMLFFINFEIENSKERIEKEKKLSNEIIMVLNTTLDIKDVYTGGHSNRVAKYSKMIAEKMNLKEEKIDLIYKMALLHDIGKIGIYDTILNKDSKLTDDEFMNIKEHPMKGYQILSKIEEIPELKFGARWHHERFDGKGYPDGIKGEDIPIEVRIISVADSYDAMTSNRSYRKYLPQEVVKEEIKKNKGTQFDPKVADIMIEIINEDKDYLLHE